MRSMRDGLDDRLNRAADITDEAGPTTPARHAGWGDVMKSLLMVQVGRAAQRVLRRQASTPESGRLGGEVHAATAGTMPRTGSPPRSREKTRSARAEEAEKGDEPAPKGAIGIGKRAFTEFGKDNGTLMAAAAAFYLVLSLVPLVLVALAIFGHIVDAQQAKQAVQQFMNQFFPAQSDMLMGWVDGAQKARGKLGLIGLGSLLLTSTGGFATLETAINIAWGAPNRNFIWNKLFALLMMVVVGGLLILSVGISTAVAVADDVPPLKWLSGSWILQALGTLISLVVSGLMFTAMFKLFPNMKVAWKPALISGFITAAMWELFKNIYTHFSTEQTASYGAMAGFVGIIMLIYYFSALALLGSELTWVLAGCPKAPAPEAKKKKH